MSSKKTPLMKASLQGHSKIVKYLIQKGASSSLADNEGWTSLHNAASRGHTDVASILIVDGEVDCNPRSSSGFTPLMSAASQGHVKLIQILLDSGADPTIRNDYGETAFDIAAQHENAYICQTLQRAERAWVRDQYSSSSSIARTVSISALSPSSLQDKIHSVVLEIIHENQRASLFSNEFASDNLTQNDLSLIGGPYSTPYGQATSKESVRLPIHDSGRDGDSDWFWLTDWKIDKSFPNLDNHGWIYASSFEVREDEWGSQEPSRFMGLIGGSWVRRRRWIRIRKRRVDLDNLGFPVFSRQFSETSVGVYEEDGYIVEAKALVTQSLDADSNRRGSNASLGSLNQELNVYMEAINILITGIKSEEMIRSKLWAD
jgi:hypothetical protein